MEWVEGMPLDRYITDSLPSPTAGADLRAAALAWAHSCHSLRHLRRQPRRRARRQHPGADARWRTRPGAAGRLRQCLGAGAEHALPGDRQRRLPTSGLPALPSGPDRDALPNTLTYLSLIGVANDPGLWVHHGDNDDTLLFAHTDLEDPSSQVWDGLAG